MKKMKQGKEQMIRVRVVLNGLGSVIDQKRYYKALSHIEDVPQNMEHLFNEMEVIYNMFHEELDELEEIIKNQLL